jgi:hypothetical protein
LGGGGLICFLNAYIIYLQSNKQMPYFEPPMTDVQHKIICKKSNWKNNNICSAIYQNCGNFENHWVAIANAEAHFLK